MDREQLDLIAQARDMGLITEHKARRLAAGVLDRSGLAELDPAVYLAERGIEGPELMAAVGPFGKALKAAFVFEYGREPLKRLKRIDGRVISVFEYVEADRDLFDAVFVDFDPVYAEAVAS